MSCQRTLEIDLMAFAADRMASDWAEFRAHYPRCPECSQAVARLTAFEAALRPEGDAPPGHLEEDEMLSLAEGTLEAERTRVAEAHLEQCSACRTEIAVLRSFELETAAVADGSASAAPSAGTDGRSRSAPSMIDRFREAVTPWLSPNPGWATAAVVATVVLIVWSVGDRIGGDPPTQLVENESVPPSPSETEVPRSPDEPRAIEPEPQLAESASDAQTADVEEGELDAGDGTPTLATRPEPSPTPSPSSPDSPAPAAEEEEIVLLAALLPSDLPRYAMLEGIGLESDDHARVRGALRNPRPGIGSLSVLAPDHAGVTRRASPTLYWALERNSNVAADFVLVDPRRIAPIFERRIPSPIPAGLHSLDLAEAGIALDPGVDYVWSVSLIPEESEREFDVVSMASIRRLAPQGDGSSESTPQERAREIHRLAAEGSWYDAHDALSRLIERMPQEGRLVEYRRALLSQVDLEDVFPWIEREAADDGKAPSPRPSRSTQ